MTKKNILIVWKCIWLIDWLIDYIDCIEWLIDGLIEGMQRTRRWWPIFGIRSQTLQTLTRFFINFTFSYVVDFHFLLEKIFLIICWQTLKSVNSLHFLLDCRNRLNFHVFCFQNGEVDTEEFMGGVETACKGKKYLFPINNISSFSLLYLHFPQLYFLPLDPSHNLHFSSVFVFPQIIFSRPTWNPPCLPATTTFLFQIFLPFFPPIWDIHIYTTLDTFVTRYADLPEAFKFFIEAQFRTIDVDGDGSIGG